MSRLQINLVSDLSQSQLNALLKPSSENYEQAQALKNMLSAAQGGEASLSLEIANGGLAASSTVTCSGVQADDTVTIDSQVLTAKAVPATAAQFKIGLTDQETAANLAAAINALPALQSIAEAQRAEKVVTVAAAFVGTKGNGITVATSNGTRLANGGNMAGAANGTVARYRFNLE